MHISFSLYVFHSFTALYIAFFGYENFYLNKQCYLFMTPVVVLCHQVQVQNRLVSLTAEER